MHDNCRESTPLAGTLNLTKYTCLQIHGRSCHSVFCSADGTDLLLFSDSPLLLGRPLTSGTHTPAFSTNMGIATGQAHASRKDAQHQPIAVGGFVGDVSPAFVAPRRSASAGNDSNPKAYCGEAAVFGPKKQRSKVAAPVWTVSISVREGRGRQKKSSPGFLTRTHIRTDV